ncbi:MAG: hypothetical protein JST54_03125 [Deltaproteobacteria bacterium]|nr:hypothetical protein [Deltaproteobacteria bacterium]
MRKSFAIFLVLGGCAASRADLVQKLHTERQEVQSSESSELPYRAKTPELGPLRGEPRADLMEELGPAECGPGPRGQRCIWRMSTGAGEAGQRPLLLRVDFDASEVCVAAGWAEAE